MKVKNNYMLSGVTEKIQKQIIENIPYNKQQDLLKATRDWIMANDSSKRGWYNSDTQRRNSDREADKWLYSKDNPNRPRTPGDDSGLRTPDVAEQSDVDVVTALNTKMEDNGAILRADSFNFLVDYSVKAERQSGGKRTREEIIQALKDYQKNDKTYLSTKYEKAKQIVEKDPSKFSDINDKLYKARQSEIQVQDDKLAYQKHISDAYKNSKDFDPNFLDNLGKQDIGTYTMEYYPHNVFQGGLWEDKIKTTVTPGDLVQLHIAMKNSFANSFGIFDSKEKNAKQEAAEAYIVQKFGMNPSTMYNIFTGQTERGSIRNVTTKAGVADDSTTFFSGDKTFIQFNKDSNKINTSIASEQYNNSINAFAKSVRDTDYADINYVYTVYGKNATDTERKSTNDAIAEVLAPLANAGGTADLEQFQYVGEKGYRPLITKDNSGDVPRWYLQMANKDRTIGQPVEISRANAHRIKPEMNLDSEKVSRAVEKMNLNQGETTNSITTDIHDPNAYKGGYKGQDWFEKNFKTTDVKGVDIRAASGGVNLCFYVKNEDGEIQPVLFRVDNTQNLPITYSSIDEANAALNLLQPKDMKEIIKQAN